MGAAGFEPAAKTRENHALQKATGPISGPADPELQILNDRWHTLPQTIRHQIARLADSASLALDGVTNNPAVLKASPDRQTPTPQTAPIRKTP